MFQAAFANRVSQASSILWCRMVLKLLRLDSTCTLFQLAHQFKMPTQP